MMAIVLAAGESSRFGSCKSLFQLNGKTMIDWVIDAIPREMKKIIITGKYHRELTDHLSDESLTIIYNERFQYGIGSSIKKAMKFTIPLNQPTLLTLSDLPYVTVDEYRNLLNDYRGKTLFSTSKGIISPPCLLSPRDQVKLLCLKDNQGAKSLIKDFDTIQIENALKDIDTLEEVCPINIANTTNL